MFVLSEVWFGFLGKDANANDDSGGSSKEMKDRQTEERKREKYE